MGLLFFLKPSPLFVIFISLATLSDFGNSFGYILESTSVSFANNSSKGMILSANPCSYEN